MNLIIDIGNTQTKVAIFDTLGIVHIVIGSSFNAAQFKNLKLHYPLINRAILSSVSDVDTDLLEVLNKECTFFVEFKSQTPIPIGNKYESKETLGLDRLAAAVGAYTIFPGKDLLVIDAGTAITYDLIDNCANFLGGNISPGLKMRFKALHEFTSKLPEIAPCETWPAYGRNTQEAIQVGVLQGMIFEIDGTIDNYRKEIPEIEIILTGGDSLFFEKKLKNTIFVKFDLTLIGLNRILEFNTNNN
jgi:type III pantothenate kinase